MTGGEEHTNTEDQYSDEFATQGNQELEMEQEEQQSSNSNNTRQNLDQTLNNLLDDQMRITQNGSLPEHNQHIEGRIQTASEVVEGSEESNNYPLKHQQNQLTDNEVIRTDFVTNPNAA